MMDTNVKFQQQKAIIDELKKGSLITNEEWYLCLTKLLKINNEKSNK
jgi:hypothetical protein